jgi:hypothetical protein
MISWEDGRNDGTGKDIYFQEYNYGVLSLQAGGGAVSVFNQKQEHPIIVKFAEDDYVILWEDYRSTGKEFCANLYGQSYYSVDCPDVGDINGDAAWNVLDIVALANCVLSSGCDDLPFYCAADMNFDGFWNVLDIVQLANCVLAQNCSGGGRVRVDDATESKLIMRDNMVSIEADGFIGGVEMTLQHEADFSIEMTDRALFADYLTTGNETRLLVITPETDELFSYSGDFEISEVIVANSQNEVPTSLPTTYYLSAAYPNPFNPSTTMKLFMPEAGEMQVKVYNLLGQSVAILTSGYMEKGKYDLVWNASNVSSGIYFVKAQAEEFTTSQKLMLVK